MVIRLGYPELYKCPGNHITPVCWFWGSRGDCKTEPWWSDESYKNYLETGKRLYENLVDNITYECLEWSQEFDRFEFRKYTDYIQDNKKFFIPIRLTQFNDDWKDLDYLKQAILPEDALSYVRQGRAVVLFFSLKEAVVTDRYLQLVRVFVANNQIPKEQCIVLTSNLHELDESFLDCFKIYRIPFFLYNCNFLEGKKSYAKGVSVSKEKPYRFLCLNRRINCTRPFVVGFLKSSTVLQDQSLISFGMEGLLGEDLVGQDVLQYLDRWKNSKYYDRVVSYYIHNRDQSVLSSLDFPEDRKLQTDIQHLNKLLYDQSYINLVTETYNDDSRKGSIFITEKTYKSIYMCQPFLLFSRPGTLQALKEQGFKTFSAWWDESYDTIEDDQERMDTVLKLVEEISSWTPEYLHSVYMEMQEVLDHNQKVFLDYKPVERFFVELWKNL